MSTVAAVSAIVTPSTVVFTRPVTVSVKTGSVSPKSLVWGLAVTVSVAGVIVRVLPVNWIV